MTKDVYRYEDALDSAKFERFLAKQLIRRNLARGMQDFDFIIDTIDLGFGAGWYMVIKAGDFTLASTLHQDGYTTGFPTGPRGRAHVRKLVKQAHKTLDGMNGGSDSRIGYMFRSAKWKVKDLISA